MTVTSEHPDPIQLMLKALRHPLRREVLRRYLEATEPLGPKELADEMRKPVPTVGYHVRELERCQAIEFVEEEKRRGSVAHFYEATWWARLTPWAVEALGLDPDEQRRRLDAAIAERREDKEFMGRLKQRLEEDGPVLKLLREAGD